MPIKKKVKKSALRSRPKLVNRDDIRGANNIRKIERRYQVFCMRRDGFTIHDIATALSATPATIREDIQVVLSQSIRDTNETVEEHRQLVLERSDELLKSFMPLTRDQILTIDDQSKPGEKKDIRIPASMNAADLVLRVDAARRKMLALDVPEVKKLDVTGIREYVGVDVDDI